MDSESEMDALDSTLVSKFRSMGTTDRDVLISQFQGLLGFQLNPAGCAFFLDMTNWNLQSAVGAYYDFEGSLENKLPKMTFVIDVTVGEGEAVSPNTPFVKTWRLQNSGKEDWPIGCTLRFLNGEKFGAQDCVPIQSVTAGQTADISISLVSPVMPGTYQGQWRTYTNAGTPFGDTIWVIISVTQTGLLDITQQFSKVSCSFGEGGSLVKDSTSAPQQPGSSVPTCDEEMAMDEIPTLNQNSIPSGTLDSNIRLGANNCNFFTEGSMAVPFSNPNSRGA